MPARTSNNSGPYSEIFFETVLSQLEDHVCIWNKDKQCVYANDQLERLWGLKREQYMWKTPTQLGFSESGSRLFEGNIAQVCATGEAVTGSFPYLGSNATRHYECIFNPVRDQQGRVEFVACVTRDVTERKLAEERLQESERQFQLLFESLEEAFCLLRVSYDEAGEPVDFVVEKVNPAFERHTGLGDIVGRNSRDIVPDLEDKWIQVWTRVAKTGQSACLVDQSAALGRWYDSCIYAMEGPRSAHIVLLFYDITRYMY